MRYVKLLMLGFTFLMLTSAAPAKHTRHKCQHCTHGEKAKATKADGGIWGQVLTGFELQSGFRWETEHECPTISRRTHHNPTVTDPFFVGVGLRLPLASTVGVAGNFDRDFTDAPRWQARAAIYFQPFKR